MSRSFTKNVSNYLALGSAVGLMGALMAGADEVCFHLHVNPTSLTTADFNNRLLTTFVGGGSAGIQCSVHDGTSAKFKVAARSQAADTLQVAHGTTVLSTGTPYALGGRIDIGGDQILVYVNGALETTQGVTFGATTYTQTTVTAGNMDSLGSAIIGGVPASTAGQWDGAASELALWTFASGDTPMATSDFLALANGLDPRRVAKGTLRYYLQILGAASPEVPVVGTGNGVITGSLPQATHPTVWGPPSVVNRRRQAA